MATGREHLDSLLAGFRAGGLSVPEMDELQGLLTSIKDNHAEEVGFPVYLGDRFVASILLRVLNDTSVFTATGAPNVSDIE